MPKLLSSVLIIAVLAAAAPLMAQPGAAQSTARGTLEVAVTYGATLSGSISSSSFWMQGGSVEMAGNFSRSLSAVADIGGMHKANINASGVGLDLVTATFGPRYSWRPANKRYDFFGQGLVGEANGFNSLFPNASGATASASSLAVQAGGGMNVALSPHLALRPCEINWLRTQLPNAAANVQNNLRFGAGVAFRFR